mgnify:CR=1 FL=1
MDINFNINEDFNKLQLTLLKKKLLKVYKGGGESSIEKHKAKGKLTARERVDYLFDKNSNPIEIGAFAGDDMYKEHGGCPSGGVIVKIGYIKGKQCIVVANDATVKAGAWFPITGKKNLRAQEISIENKLPIIYLVDSAGVYLPMQDEIFPDKGELVRTKIGEEYSERDFNAFLIDFLALVFSSSGTESSKSKQTISA